MYTCVRQWDDARADYKKVLSLEPHNEAATKGLIDAEDVVHTSPMIDSNILNNGS